MGFQRVKRHLRELRHRHDVDLEKSRVNRPTWVYDTTLTGANGRDTSRTGPWDPDLSGPFTMAGGTDVVNPGNVLVIQESAEKTGIGRQWSRWFLQAVVFQCGRPSKINVFDAACAVTFDLFDESDTKFATFQNLLNSDTGNNEPTIYSRR